MLPCFILLFMVSISSSAEVLHSGTRLATVSVVESDKIAGYVTLKWCFGFVNQKKNLTLIRFSGELRVVEHSSKAQYLLTATDPTTVAWGNFTNEIETTGWSYLEVSASPEFPDAVQVGILLHLLKQEWNLERKPLQDARYSLRLDSLVGLTLICDVPRSCTPAQPFLPI